MCVRWHIKGNCNNNCSCAISHVSKENILMEKRANFLTFMKKCREAAKMNDWLLGLEPSSIRPLKTPPDKNILLPFEFEFCPTPLDTQQQHNQHQQPLGDIDLPTWQQHPTSAREQPSRDFDLPPWQQPSTCAPNTPNPWLDLTTTMSKADKMAVAKVKARKQLV